MNGVVFSPKDNDKFYTYSSDSSIKQWSFSKEEPTLGITGAHVGNILTLSVSSNGKALLSTSTDKNISLWDAANMKRTAETSTDDACTAAGFLDNSTGSFAVVTRGGRLEHYIGDDHANAVLEKTERNNLSSSAGPNLADALSAGIRSRETNASKNAYSSPNSSNSVVAPVRATRATTHIGHGQSGIMTLNEREAAVGRPPARQSLPHSAHPSSSLSPTLATNKTAPEPARDPYADASPLLPTPNIPETPSIESILTKEHLRNAEYKIKKLEQEAAALRNELTLVKTNLMNKDNMLAIEGQRAAEVS